MPQTSANQVSSRRPQAGLRKHQASKHNFLTYLRNLPSYFWIGWTAPRPPKLNYPDPPESDG